MDKIKSQLGIWGLREEARKSWEHIVSDVSVYFCDLKYSQLQGNRIGRIDWITKYQCGNAWLEYHGILEGEGPTEFYAIIEIYPGPADWANREIPLNSPSCRKAVFVDIAKFIKLPEGVIPESFSSMIRLKLFDNVNGIGRDSGNSFFEFLPVFNRIMPLDGEHEVNGRSGISYGGKLPGQLIESRTQRVNEVREAKDKIGSNQDVFTAYDMATAHKVVMFRDFIWVGPTVLGGKKIKFLEMFVRPAYFHSKIFESLPV